MCAIDCANNIIFEMRPKPSSLSGCIYQTVGLITIPKAKPITNSSTSSKFPADSFLYNV